MCDETQRLQPFIKKWAGRSVKELFLINHINPVFRYDNVHPGNCLVCKNPLSHRQMWPSGRCPRCMCEHCYSKIILGTINHHCIISGDPLPSRQVQAQQLNPREVANNIKSGYARDYYTLIACKALGEELSFLMDEAYVPRHNSHPHYGDNRKNVIDAEYYDLPNHTQTERTALPYLHDVSKVPAMPDTYNGKKIKVIANRKRHR